MTPEEKEAFKARIQADYAAGKKPPEEVLEALRKPKPIMRLGSVRLSRPHLKGQSGKRLTRSN